MICNYFCSVDYCQVTLSIPSTSTSNDDAHSQIQEISENSAHSSKSQFFKQVAKKRKPTQEIQPTLPSCYERSSSFEVSILVSLFLKIYSFILVLIKYIPINESDSQSICKYIDTLDVTVTFFYICVFKYIFSK